MKGLHHRGFSLAELFIALSLGLLLSAVVLQVTLASQRSQRLLNEAARLQENGRFALNTMTKELRSAGFMGCPSLEKVALNTIAKEPPAELDFTPAGIVRGVENVSENNAYDAVVGSDVIEFQRGVSPPARLTGNLNVSDGTLQIEENPAGLGSGDFFIVSDCVSADLLKATKVKTDVGSSSATISYGVDDNNLRRLGKVYSSTAEVLGYQSATYFIRSTGRKTAGGAAIHSLYSKVRQLGNGSAPTSLELVEGVEDMQLTYGIDTDDDYAVDDYQTADEVSDWSSVLSVRVALLMQGIEDNIIGKRDVTSQNLEFNGGSTPRDGRLRKIYQTTVSLRNRLP